MRTWRRRARGVAEQLMVLAAVMALSIFAVEPGNAQPLERASGRARASIADDTVISTPVEFTVSNLNRSRIPCLSDGAGSVVVRGVLEAPVWALRGPSRSVTLYLHSPVLAGGAEWRFDDVHGYDHSAEMAAMGHVSVTIDRLGYGESTIPHGSATCYGSAADVASQIVRSLRTGSYTSPTLDPVAFDRVAIAGFSGGGLVAEAAAYSFGGIDALVVIGWAESGHAPGFALAAAPDLTPCASGGDEKHPGGPAGYATLFTDAMQFEQWLFSDTDPDVLSAARGKHEADPCGELQSIPQALLANSIGLGDITVPVLLIFGEADAVYPGQAADDQRQRFTGSSDVTLARIPRSGHTVMLERGAPTFRSLLADWLGARGF